MRRAGLIVGILLWASGNLFSGGDELRLQGSLQAAIEAGDVSGRVEYRQRFERGGRRQFSVQIEGFEPGLMFDVMLAGTVVGRLEVDSVGIAELNYDDNFEAGVDDPATRFPLGFPVLDGGELVTVGPLSANLQPR